MDLITYGLLNKAKANLDSPAFTGTPTAPTPLTPDNSNKLATTEFVRSVIATLKGFYLGVTTTTLVDEVTTDPNVVINGETVTAEDGNWVIASGGEEFVYSGTVWQKFGDSNWISVIGDTYKSNLTYNTHDCVIYMDGLYECKEDNVTGDWDSTKWQSTTVIDLITGGIPLENLLNVDIVNPQAGNHLVFDGTKWKNSTIVSPALSELSDVELENVTDGQALVYNDTTDKWENQDIPTGQVTKEASGNPIELTDAANAPMVKCVTQITGSQDLHGYDKPWVGGAGKNKFDIDTASEGYIDADGNFVSLGGFKASDYIPINSNTDYTLSYIRGSGAGSRVGMRIAWYDSSKVFIKRDGVDNEGTDPGLKSTTAQAPNGTSYARISIPYSYSGTVIANDIQFEIGSTATSFAPYSNICPITAYTEGEIEVRGKNMFNIDPSAIVEGSSIASVSGNTVRNTSTSAWASVRYQLILPAGTYTASIGTLTQASSGATIQFATYNGESYTQLVALTASNEHGTFTLSAQETVRVSLYSSASNNPFTIAEIQIESGSTATTYEPYTSTTHTTTYPSAIYRGSEDVINGTATENWIKLVFDGSNDENWQYAGTPPFLYIDIPNGIVVDNTTQYDKDYVISNMYKTSDWVEKEDFSIFMFYNASRIAVKDSNFGSDVSSFKAFLANNPLEIAYFIPNPTTSSVTPTNLPIRTLSGYNHIESSTGEMEVEYITEEEQPIIDLIESNTINIVPNPEGSATTTLNKLGIDNVIYDFPKELPPVTSTDNNKVLTVVNGAWTKANPQTGMSESVIADEYNPLETYNIADYCMHNSKMYKCNTNNTTGAWDNTKWNETCVGDELTLKTAVIVAPRVDQTATYTYNGTEQTLAFEYINSNNTMVTGNKHTDAGTYTCTVSLKNPNDLWSDTMDNVDKTFTWTINKVTSSITLSPTTFYFSNGTPQTLTATVVGQPLVLSGYDTSLITISQVSVVNGVYTYNIKATGTAGTTTITASIAASTNYTAASAIASVETEAFTPGATLVPWSSGTDQEITDMINSYYNGEITLEDVKSVWSIGDVRNVDISAMTATGVGESHRAQTVEMEILDFDHDTLTTPVGSITKALITVDMKNCLRDANVTDTTGSSNTEHGYMNSSNTNVGGWTSCARRTWCNNVFYNALPSYFKNLVKPVDKLTSAGNQSDIINTDSDYCFLLSEIEIFGSITYSKAGEGNQYAWFANATANRYKLPKWNSSSVSDAWWERSPGGSNSNYFCLVNDNGYANNYRASNAYGLAPACCL